MVAIKNNKYAITVNTDDESLVEMLSSVPGLCLDRDNSRFVGRIDAVAAACHRLGVQPIPPAVTLGAYNTAIPLKDYQFVGASTCKTLANTHGAALLADDMGLGKSRQAISFAIANKGRTFIVCPAAVRDTWAEELTKLGISDFAILEPTATKKGAKVWKESVTKQWVITSYALADKAFDAAFTDSPPRTLVIDEFHNLRGRDAQRSRNIRNIAAQVDYKLGLTGTPQWSRVRDWWSLLSVLFGNAFGNRYVFDTAYCNGRKNEHGGWDNSGATNTEELKLRLSYYMVRRTKAEVAKELPKLTRQVLWVDADDKATVAFHQAISTKNSHATQAAFQATLSGKIEAAVELAVQAKQFLLFTYLKSHAHQIAKVLNEELDTPCVCLTGDSSPTERQALVQQAISRNIGVVATIDSAGTGINGLQTHISVGIFHALDYVPIKLAQAEARLERIGQLLPVNWYYIAMKDSVDSLVVKTIISKLDATRAILGEDSNLPLRNTIADSSGDETSTLKALYDSL